MNQNVGNTVGTRPGPHSQADDSLVFVYTVSLMLILACVKYVKALFHLDTVSCLH